MHTNELFSPHIQLNIANMFLMAMSQCEYKNNLSLTLGPHHIARSFIFDAKPETSKSWRKYREVNSERNSFRSEMTTTMAASCSVVSCGEEREGDKAVIGDFLTFIFLGILYHMMAVNLVL